MELVDAAPPPVRGSPLSGYTGDCVVSLRIREFRNLMHAFDLLLRRPLIRWVRQRVFHHVALTASSARAPLHFALHFHPLLFGLDMHGDGTPMHAACNHLGLPTRLEVS